MKKAQQTRKGKFIWMPSESRQKHINKFKKRIKSGYYSSEKIASILTERLASTFDSELNRLI